MTDAQPSAGAVAADEFGEPAYTITLSGDFRKGRAEWSGADGLNISVGLVDIPRGSDAEADLTKATRHGAKKALKALLQQLKDD